MADDGLTEARQKETTAVEEDIAVAAAATDDSNNRRSTAVEVDDDEVPAGLLVEKLVSAQMHVEDKMQKASHSTRSYEQLIASFEGKRKGPWSQVEHSYVVKLIECFNAGYFDIPQEIKLRDFLAQKLFWYSHDCSFVVILFYL